MFIEFDDNFPQRATSKVCFFVNINTLVNNNNSYHTLISLSLQCQGK